MNSQPLDGGWGWMVVLASCANNFLIVGLARTIGVLFKAIVIHFDTSATLVAFITGLSSGCRMFGGPVASYMFLKFDGRLVVMFGGLLVGVGFVASAWSPNAYLLLLTFSAFTGIGGCFIFTPSYVILNQYFDKHRGKALGLGTLGAGLGSIALAPLNAFLLAEYGYRGTMLIVGGIMLNNCVAGALYRPIQQNRPKRDKRNIANDELTTELSTTDSGLELKGTETKGYGTELESTDTKLIGHGTELELKEPESTDTEMKDYGADTKLRVTEDSIIEENSSVAPSQKSGWKEKFEICTHFSFVIYCFQIMAMPLCVSNYLLWLPTYAQDLGASASLGALLVSVSGVADIVGRLIGGAIFDIRVVRRNKRLCHTVVALGMASCVIATGLAGDYWVVLGIVVAYGLLEGTFHSQRTSIASFVVPEHLMPHSVGFLIFSQGGGTFCGPIMGGFILDMTGSCHWNFLLNGGLFFMFSFFFLLDYFCRKQQTKAL